MGVVWVLVTQSEPRLCIAQLVQHDLGNKRSGPLPHNMDNSFALFAEPAPHTLGSMWSH